MIDGIVPVIRTSRMVADAEQYAESDKERRLLTEESNKADSVCADTEKGTFLLRMHEGCSLMYAIMI